MTTHYVPSATLPLVYLDISPTLEGGVTHVAFRSVDGRGAKHTIRGASFKTADLIDALGAHSRERWDDAHQSAKAERDKVRAERDEARGKLARIRNTVAWPQSTDMDTFRGELAAVLNTPTFTLPKDTGVRFTAKHKATGETLTFETVTAHGKTWWIDAGGRDGLLGECMWSAANICGQFTDHRLLDA